MGQIALLNWYFVGNRVGRSLAAAGLESFRVEHNRAQTRYHIALQIDLLNRSQSIRNKLVKVAIY